MNLTQLVRKLSALATETAALEKQARKLGLFTNERDLLECAECGLLEDVGSDGRLLTCWPTSLAEDTGLRFKALSKQRFRCPACGATVRQPGLPTPTPAEPPSNHAKRK